MEFNLFFTKEAKLKLVELEKDKSKKCVLKQVRKVLGFMEKNLKHPSLQTHKFDDISNKLGDVFETYAQNKTPGAYRIFWVYGPSKKQISILDILPHP